MSTWHVSPLGNDANDGKSWQTAFRTLPKAVYSGTAGDTIVLGPENYDCSVGPATLRAQWTMILGGNGSYISTERGPSAPDSFFATVNAPDASIASGGTVTISQPDAPAYTFDPPKKSYSLQPNSWLARSKLLSDLIAVMIVTPPYAMLRHMHPIQGAAMAGEALLLAFSFRAILELRRRRRARREREGR